MLVWLYTVWGAMYNRMGSDVQQGGIEGVDLGCGLRRVGVGI